MIQSEDLLRSFSLSIQPRVYTIVAPSGEICGFETDSISRYVSSESRWTFES